MPTQTILPKKGNKPFALDDEHHEALANDPQVAEFPQGSSFAAFSAPANKTSAASGFGGGSTQSLAPAVQQDQSKMLQSSGGAMQEGATSNIKTDDKFGDFINSKWRPLMAVIYMITCFCDFVLFPILWSLLQAMSAGQVTSQWMPLTLQGAGLYHIAMGAVLGLAAYGRSQEKIAGKA